MKSFLIFAIALVLVQQAISIRWIRYTPRCARMFETYQTCGSSCPPTCDNTQPMCIEQCKAQCQCIQGYVRNTADGTCCLPTECPAVAPEPVPVPVPEPTTCPLNQQYNTCGTACPATCSNYNNPPQMCTMQCVIGCQCTSGYVRKADNSCCLPQDC